MAITIAQGFTVTTAQEPIDTRLIMSKAEMLVYPSARMPDHYFCVCSNDNQIYIYDESRAVSSETGKFHPLSDYMTGNTNAVVQGYYNVGDGKFYEESSYATVISPNSKQLFVDKSNIMTTGYVLYICDGTNYHQVSGGGGGTAIDPLVQGYYYNGKFYTTAAHATEITANKKQVYVDLTDNKYNIYVYNGTEYKLASGGSSSGDKSYIYTVGSASPQNTWVINHNLGKNPSVTIVDGDDELEGDITYNSLNQITIDFTKNVSGTAYLN